MNSDTASRFTQIDEFISPAETCRQFCALALARTALKPRELNRAMTRSTASCRGHEAATEVYLESIGDILRQLPYELCTFVVDTL